MKVFTWNIDKNEWLKSERGVSFEEVVLHIENDLVLDIIEHPNKEKFGHQRIYVININDYAYLVPFVETNEEVFLKTVIPSRKATQKYLKGDEPNG